MHIDRFVRIAFSSALALVGVVGCGGGTSSPVSVGMPIASIAPSPSPTPSPVPISASPTTLTYGLGDPAIQVNLSGLGSGVTAKASDPRLVDISAPLVNGASASVSVTPVASGTTNIVFSNGYTTTTVAVTIAMCSPESPYLNQVTPAAGANGVSAGLASLLWVTSTSGYPGLIPSYSVRLIGASGTVVPGGALSAVPAPSPLPSGINSSTGLIFASASIPQLAPGTTYQVQLYTKTFSCLPPFITGSFST